MLEEVGISVTVEPLALAAFVDKLGSGNYEMGIINYNAAAPSAADPLGFLASTGALFSQSDPAAANAALAELAEAATDEQMNAATSGFEEWAYASTVVIPLAMPDAIYAVSPTVGGFTPNHYRSWRAENVRIAG